MAKAKAEPKETKTDEKTKPYRCILGVWKDGKRIPSGRDVALTDDEAAPLLELGAVESALETRASAKDDEA